jgi:hypothetical protein
MANRAVEVKGTGRSNHHSIGFSVARRNGGYFAFPGNPSRKPLKRTRSGRVAKEDGQNR